MNSTCHRTSITAQALNECCYVASFSLYTFIFFSAAIFKQFSLLSILVINNSHWIAKEGQNLKFFSYFNKQEKRMNKYLLIVIRSGIETKNRWSLNTYEYYRNSSNYMTTTTLSCRYRVIREDEYRFTLEIALNLNVNVKSEVWWFSLCLTSKSYSSYLLWYSIHLFSFHIDKIVYNDIVGFVVFSPCHDLSYTKRLNFILMLY